MHFQTESSYWYDCFDRVDYSFFTNYINSRKVSVNSRASTPATPYITITPVQSREPTPGSKEERRLRCLDELPILDAQKTKMIKVGLYIHKDFEPVPSIIMYVYKRDGSAGNDTLLSTKYKEEIDSSLQVARVDLDKYRKTHTYYYSQITKISATPTPSTSNPQPSQSLSTVTGTPNELGVCEKID